MGGGGGGCVLKMNGYKLVGGSGGMLLRENFRNFEMPWTTFHAFSWWRKRERQRRVATRIFISFYKNEAQIWPKIKNNVGTIQAGIWNHRWKVYFS